jgi:hypothetical protein
VTITTLPRTYDDDQRVKLATVDGARMVGPLEVALCSHGARYSFRYGWPKGSGGPKDGVLRIMDNTCVECAREGWLTPGATKQV